MEEDYMIAAIQRYVVHRIPPGSFGMALLSNDLKEICAGADSHNIRRIPELVSYCWNHIPNACWGSPEKVTDWLNGGKNDC